MISTTISFDLQDNVGEGKLNLAISSNLRLTCFQRFCDTAAWLNTKIWYFIYLLSNNVSKS